jgi:hypothetical protein
VHVRQFRTRSTRLAEFGPRHFPFAGFDSGGDGRDIVDVITTAGVGAGTMASAAGVSGAMGNATGIGACATTGCGTTACRADRIGDCTGEPPGDENSSGVLARSP